MLYLKDSENNTMQLAAYIYFSIPRKDFNQLIKPHCFPDFDFFLKAACSCSGALRTPGASSISSKSWWAAHKTVPDKRSLITSLISALLSVVFVWHFITTELNALRILRESVCLQVNIVGRNKKTYRVVWGTRNIWVSVIYSSLWAFFLDSFSSVFHSLQHFTVWVLYFRTIISLATFTLLPHEKWMKTFWHVYVDLWSVLQQIDQINLIKDVPRWLFEANYPLGAFTGKSLKRNVKVLSWARHQVKWNKKRKNSFSKICDWMLAVLRWPKHWKARLQSCWWYTQLDRYLCLFSFSLTNVSLQSGLPRNLFSNTFKIVTVSTLASIENASWQQRTVLNSGSWRNLKTE